MVWVVAFGWVRGGDADIRHRTATARFRVLWYFDGVLAAVSGSGPWRGLKATQGESVLEEGWVRP